MQTPTSLSICGQMKTEMERYFGESVPLATGEHYSEWKLKKRIYTYKNRYYPTGKVNSNGEVEYWFDGIHPRVSDEIKNLRLDSKYFLVWHKNPIDYFAATYIANASLSDFMDTSGRAEELMSANEDFSADGNVLWKKTDNFYEKCDMLNTFITNVLAKTVNETAIIERFYLTQNELRKKDGLYKNVSEVIEKCGNTYFKTSEKSVGTNKTTPMYELYRRVGEVSEATLFKAQGKEKGNSNKFLLASIIVCGLSGGEEDEYVLYAEELQGEMSDWFKEAHRGPFKGRWWREGLYELLFDHQTAYNEITNEVMRSIPWNTSAFFRHTDVRTQNSIRRNLKRGSLVKSADLQQVQVSSRINEAITIRNTILQEMDRLAGSYEVVQGVTPASGTPLGTTQLMNENANKLYDFLRKKLAVPYRHIYTEFVLPELVKDLKGKEIIRVTGDSRVLEGLRRIVAESWFFNNLVLIGSHTPEMKEALIEEKVKELETIDPLLKNSRDIWKEITPGLRVTVIGENWTGAEVGTLSQIIPLEMDPVRRGWMIDYILKSKGIDVPPPAQPQQPTQGQNPQIEEEQGMSSPLQEEPVPSEV